MRPMSNRNHSTTSKNFRNTHGGQTSSKGLAQRVAARLSSIKRTTAGLTRFVDARLLLTFVAIALVATILTTTAYMQSNEQSQKPTAPSEKTLKEDPASKADSVVEAAIEPMDAPALPSIGDYSLPTTFTSSASDVTVPNAPLVALTGTKNIPGDYATLAAAITDLNTQGVGAGGVTFNVIAGNPQTAPTGGYVIGNTGSLVLTTSSAANPIVFTGNANTVTAPTPQTSGNLNDAIFKLIGADFVTIQGFTIQENASNTTTAAGTNNMTEWGVALLYVTTTNGSQNNTIQNNTISLSRLYQNSFGIYSNVNHTATSISTSATITNVTGSNFGNKVYGNSISNVNYGTVFIGSSALTAVGAQDNGNDIGGASAATGNTYTNWGGIGVAPSSYVTLTGSNYCIFTNNQYNDNISFNNITSATGTSSITTGGILKNYSTGTTAQPTGTITTTINNNTVTVTNNGTAGIIGINNQGLSPLLSTATMSMNNNTVQNCVLGGTTSTTTGITAITNLSLPGTMNMTGNTVSGNSITSTTATTGQFSGISNSGAGGTVNMTGNSIVNNSIATASSTSGLIVAMSNSGAAGTVNMNTNIVRSMASTAASGQMQGIVNSGAVVTALNMNSNQLGNATSGFFSSSVASSGSLFGITTSAGASTCALSMTGNDIRGVTYSVAASAAQNYLQNTAATLSQNISSNTFTNLNVNTTGSVTFIADGVSLSSTGTKNINSNQIVTAFNKGGAGGTVSFYADGGLTSPAGAVSNANNNNFSNITVTGITAIAGWNNQDGNSSTDAPTKSFTGNTFSNISAGNGGLTIASFGFCGTTGNLSSNTISNVSATGPITGLSLNSSNNNVTVSQNTINTLSTTGGSAVLPISVASATTGNLFKNKIYDIQANNAAGTVNGILVSGGTTSNVFNNLIGDLRTPLANTTNPLIGINITGGTTINVSYNSVYLNGTSSGSPFGSSAISTSTTPTLTLRNNVFVNTSATAGGALAAAYRRSSTTLTTYAAASNNNDFFASTIFTDGTNTDAGIAAYKARVTTRDSASFSENPPFLSTIGSSANFLHIDPATPTQLESGGTPVGGITDDFDGQVRNVSTPDVGADEFAGTPPPNMSYSSSTTEQITGTAAAGSINQPIIRVKVVTTGSFNPLSLTSLTLNANGTTAITDINATTAKVYYTGASTTFSTATLFGSATPTIANFNVTGTQVLTEGDNYFWLAYDVIPGATTGNLIDGECTSLTVVTAQTPTVTAPAGNKSIIGPLTGNYNVGAAQTSPNYATITSALADLNSRGLSGPVAFTLMDSSYSGSETFPLTINSLAGSSATNTITIKPNTGVSPAISGSSASCIIALNGADYVTVDGSNAVGGTSRDLTVTNTNTGTSSAGICLLSTGANAGATNNTVKNTNIVGATTTATAATLFGVFSGTSTISITSAGADNDSNTIQNNSITKTSYGIYSGGASAANKNTGTVITQNVMNAASPTNITTGGILANFEDGIQITRNDISVLKHDGTTGTTGTAFGIALGVVPNNTVTTFTGSDVINASVTRNKINGVTQLNSTGYSAFGIVVNSVTSGTTLLANNMISVVRSASTPSDFSAGIVAGGGTGSTTQIYFNSVSMTGTRGAATNPSYGLAINSGDPIVDVKDNIFYNTQTSLSTGKMYAIGTGSTTFVNMTSNFNDFFVSGASAFVGQTGGLGTTGTDRATLSNWQTATGKDGNSVSGDPLFTSTTDLHILPSTAATSPVSNAGTSISGVTDDFDAANVRTTSTPDIGADDFSGNFSSSGNAALAAGIYDSITVNSPDTVTLSGSVTVNSFVLVNSGGTFVMGTSQVTAGATGVTITINGTLQTAHPNGFSGSTLTAISTTNSPTIALGSASTIDYNATGSQSITARTDYANLTISGNRGGNVVTLPAATVGLSGALNITATNVLYSRTGNTIEFNGSGSQTIPVFDYNNLSSSGAGARTLINGGTIGVLGSFTPGTNSYTITGNTFDYKASTAQTVAVFNYNNLNISTARGSGVNVTLANGNIGVAGDFNLSASFSGGGALVPGTSTLLFQGTASQQYSNASGSTLANVTVNNSAGIVLNNDLTLGTAGVLNLSSGVVDGRTNTKTVSVTNTATSAVTRISGYVNGDLKRSLPLVGGPTSYLFAIGHNGYSPMTLDVTLTTGATTFTAKATQTVAPGVALTGKALQRHWSLATPGVVTAAPTFAYLAGDVPGTSTEANYRIFKDTNGSGSGFSFPDNGTDDVDESAHTATLLTPTTTYSNWSVGEPNAPTAVKLMKFAATNNNGEVMLQWQSGYEARNLGYFVYREQDGQRTQITPSLVAGSALTVGQQTVMTAGYSYTWFDQLPVGSGQWAVGSGKKAEAETQNSELQTPNSRTTYWLEDVDLNGARTLHGPIVPVIDRRRQNGRGTRSDLLSELQLREPASGILISGWPEAQSRRQKTEDSRQRAEGATQASTMSQQSIAGTPGVKLAVSKAGWYRVTQPQLAAAGLDANAIASQLQLFANGQEVPIKVSGNGGQLTSSDYIEFYGRGVEATTDTRQTYYLLSGSSAGKRIGLIGNNGALPPASGPTSYSYTLERKDRWIYYSAYLNGDAENIFGHVVNATPVIETLPVNHPDATSSAQPQLEISLVGLSLQTHHVQVSLNGADLGTIDFAQGAHPTQSFNVAAGLLHDGDNTAKLTSLGGATDTSLVDTMRLTYAHAYAADNDSLAIGINGAATTRISGFSNANVRAVDITDPNDIRELTPEVSAQPDGTFVADIQVTTASAVDPHTVVLFADGQSLQPDAITHNEPSAWSANTNRADYLLITSKEFKAGVEPLAQLRRSRGLLVNVVDVEDVYDEFSFGLHSPQAIRDFLQTATGSWARAPHFVLLAGDASFDPKNYLGQGNTDFVPTKLFDSATMETANDDWFADFNNDGVAELALGRLPVRTAADVNLIVGKIINFENAPADPSRGALLVADRDFESAGTTVQGLLPAAMPKQVINRSSADDATIHSQIISGINQGPRLVNYIGHGSNGVWTGASLLSNPDAPALTNNNQLSLFVMMTCLNGYFQNAYNDSLSEALMRNQGGAVAVWSSTGMTDPGGQSLINQEFYRQLFSAQAPTLGDAARAAKMATGDRDVRLTWTLFGDPAMKFAPQAPTASNGTVGGIITDGQGAPLAGTTINLGGATTRQAITDANGKYSFDNLEANGFYTVTPSRANYTFNPSSRSFSLLGEHTDASFTATADAVATNPLDAPEYFVRQQYLDFLGREPDESGFSFWRNQISSCGTDGACVEARRVNTSAAFFLSIEFQQSGYLVYRTYKSAYGNMPGAPVPVRLNEFTPDTAAIGRGVVVNQAGWEALLENNKQAFMSEFVQRSRFSAAYPTTMTPAEFVDRLFANAGITPSGADRANAIGEFGSTITTGDVAARARALRRVGENSTLAQRELNRAFVLMQYFGYLRRNPNDAPEPTSDYSGYNFWLNKLNSFNGNFVNAEMVKAFLVSGEYRQRFSR